MFGQFSWDNHIGKSHPSIVAEVRGTHDRSNHPAGLHLPRLPGTPGLPALPSGMLNLIANAGGASPPPPCPTPPPPPPPPCRPQRTEGCLERAVRRRHPHDPRGAGPRRPPLAADRPPPQGAGPPIPPAHQGRPVRAHIFPPTNRASMVASHRARHRVTIAPMGARSVLCAGTPSRSACCPGCPRRQES